MSLQYVEHSNPLYPPQVIFAKSGGGGNQRGQGAGKPSKTATKKPAKKGGKK